MASFNLSPIGNWFSNFGSNTAGSNPALPLSNGKLWTYQAGTTTPTPVYTTNAGVAWSNPIILGSDGRVPGAIWQASGSAIKYVLQDSLGNPIPNGTIDNVIGINDTSSSGSVSEWVVTGFVPTFSSSTTFTTPGNTTSTFQVGRRVQAFVTAGTVYGTVLSSTFGVATTVVLTMDGAQVLDGGLSAVNVGFLGSTHPSVPNNFPYPLTATALNTPNWTVDVTSGYSRNTGNTQPAFRAHLSANQTSGTAIIFGTVDSQQGGTNYASGTGQFTAPVAGTYIFSTSLSFTNGTGAQQQASVNLIAAGTTIATNYTETLTNGTIFGVCVSGIVQLSAGQIVSVSVQASPSPLSVNFVVNTTSYFMGALLF